jgi:nicotinamidase-related amidase
MAIETTAAGSALVKIFGVPVLAGAAATSLGFMFMWPTTIKEAFVRIICTILSSTILGPVLVIIVRSWFPSLFDSAKEVAVMYGSEPAFGFLFIAAPLMVMAGLPAWWVLGAIVRWFDVRKGKDIGEMAHDAAGIVHDVRGAL